MLFCRAKSRVHFACTVRDLTWELIESTFLSARFFLFSFFILDSICAVVC